MSQFNVMLFHVFLAHHLGMPSLSDSQQIDAIRSTDFILIFTHISGQISYSYSMKWYS